jgi:S-adenosylmethionine:tRNA ribosyltransferase-isomerase
LLSYGAIGAVPVACRPTAGQAVMKKTAGFARPCMEDVPRGLIYMGKDQKSIDFEYSVAAYQYQLPERLIAQRPAVNREDSRLMVMDCRHRSIAHHRFPDITKYLNSGDLLVVNDTRVFPARLHGRKETGGKIELFLLEYPERRLAVGSARVPDNAPHPLQESTATALVKSSKRPRPGTLLILGDEFRGVVEEVLPNGRIRVTLSFRGKIDDMLSTYGQVPLPPYIHRHDGEFPWDHDRYQTIYARRTGAVAAPTAGLHFSESLLAEIRAAGINTAAVTLHVGYGTFAPVRVKDIRRHQLHEEYMIIPPATADLVNETRSRGGRIWAVGTTTVRTLEFGADRWGCLQAREGWCGLYIYPGYQFRIIDNLITNFHLPGSSLMYLVAALVGRKRLLAGYCQAVDRNYRFFSYGDAMAVIR